MSKNKLVFVCLSVAIVMTILFASCAPAAPAKPATPPTPPPPPPPADAKYTNTDYGFVITYPGTWKSTPSAVPTTVFFAQGPGGAFDDFVQVNVRPGTDFTKAAIDWATEQVTAKKIDAKPALIAEKDVKMGGMDGKQVTLEVDAIIMKLGSVYYGFVKDGKVVMINVAGVIKPNVDKYAIWQKILDGITWSGAAAVPAAPAPPAPPAAPIKTSYAAKTYTNDEYGFSFQYPSSMIVGKPTAKYSLFSAADAMQVPAVGVSVYDKEKATDQGIESLQSISGTDVKSVSSDPMTGADGKTKGTLNQLAWKSSGYNITTYSFDVEKGSKIISVAYTSLTDMIDAKLAKEVVSTLTFK